MTAMILIDRVLANHIYTTEHQELYGCDSRTGTEHLIQTQQDFDAIDQAESNDIEFGIEGEIFGEPYDHQD